ncbi:MAG: hypothetical protein SAL70_25545 [Scytonema sp. PMC 1070.18]|nr:hypothetical protein [Scytonema sp. PMC 1070.18]
MVKRKENRRGFLRFVPVLLYPVSLIAIAAALVILFGGRFELASASQPNAELEIQKLT